jgi:hypothetical protein
MISEIYEGWRNHLFPPKQLKKLIKEIHTTRLIICRGCGFNSKNQKRFFLRRDEHCTQCGCTLSAKTKCLSCCCELDFPKWVCVLTEQQEEEINEANKRNSIKENPPSSLH